jgi:hypothetical protein
MAIGQNFYDTEPYWSAVSRKGSQRLLAALQAHHPDLQEHDEVSIPTIVPETPVVEVPVVPDTKPPTCPRWFSIVDEPTTIMPMIGDIKRAACRYFDIDPIDLDSSRRTLKLVYPRQLVMYLAKKKTGKSLPEIGRRLKRDHTTVLHGVRKIEQSVRSDWTVAYDVAQLEAMI